MVKKKGCICWPTIKRTGRSLRTSSDDDAADVVVKATSKASQLPSQDDGEDASIGKASELQPSIPPEHDKFLEMLFPSFGRQRSRTLSLSISHPHQQQQQPKDKRTRFRRTENPTSAAAAFRNRTLSSASSCGRRYPAALGNDLLLLDMVPATPDAYTRRGFLAATLPPGLRPGSARTRPDDWSGYMRRLEQKKLQRCQCSGCSDDICSSSYKYPTAAAYDEDDAEEERLGPFFDNESYYNTHGCCSSRERRKAVATSYDQPMSRLERQIRAGLYDFPTARHRSVLCSRRAFEKTYLYDEDVYHHKEHEEQEQEGEEEQEAGSYREEAAYDRPIAPCRESLIRQHPKHIQQSFSKIDGGESEVIISETALDSHEKYDRPIEWSANERTNSGGGGGGCNRKSRTAVVMCRKCFACSRGSEEATSADQGWYQRMNAMALLDTNLRRCFDDESSYVLSDRVGIEEGAADAIDYIAPGQRMVGRSRQKGRGGAASKRSFAADGGYLTPLKLETMRTDDGADEKKDNCRETQESPLSMRQFLNENHRKDVSKKEDIEQQREDNIDSDGWHERTEVIKGQREDPPSSSKPPTSDAGGSEEKNDSQQERNDDEKSSSVLLNQRKEAEGSSTLQLATDQPSTQQDEGLEKEITGNPKNTDKTEAYVATVNEGDNREPIDRSVGNGVTEENRRNDSRATGPHLGSQSPAVSQLDLLLMSPPPQCAYMVNHSYMNVAENETTAVGRKDVGVIVHRDVRADEEHDPRQFQRRSRPSEFYCSKQKPKACKKHFTPEESEEEFETERRLRPKASPYMTLLNKASSGYDFCNPYLPPMDECHRNTCLAT